MVRGEAAKAIGPLRKAVALAQRRSDTRFNYAKALIKAGKKEMSRRQRSKRCNRLPMNFAGRSEAAAMLKSLVRMQRNMHAA